MMMMMVPAEEDGPGSDEKDEKLECKGDQHPVAGHVALQVLEAQTKHSQLKYWVQDKLSSSSLSSITCGSATMRMGLRKAAVARSREMAGPRY